LLWVVAVAAGLALAVLCAGQGMSRVPRQQALHVLVLSEASASTVRCPSCATYVQQYASAVARDADQQIWVEHLSWQPRAGTSPEIPTVSAATQSVLRLRQALGSADLIVLRVGDEQSMITIREDSCDRAAASTSPCTTTVNEFEHQLRALLTAIDAIRHRESRLVVVAAPDPHNLTAVSASQCACDVTSEAGGICVDTVPLVASGALAPTDWHGPDDELAMDQAGHDAVARVLLRHEDR
jgi:hypothetical protein